MIAGFALAAALGSPAAAGSGWNGEWVLSSDRNPPAIKAQAARDYRFTVGGAGDLRWEIPSLKEDNRGRLDGSPMAIRRPGGTAGMTIGVTAESPYVWTYVVAKDGRPVGQGRMTLAENGRTWVDVSGPYGRPDQAGVVIYVRPGAGGATP